MDISRRIRHLRCIAAKLGARFYRTPQTPESDLENPMIVTTGDVPTATGPARRPSRHPIREIAAFGTNPGNLKMMLSAPIEPARGRPLVVVLHGCGQTAVGYDHASGWSRLAEQHDFLVLYPEQQEANNRQGCFSWFEADDTSRGFGEVESICQMVATAVARFGADPKQVYVCGLSAGGAMTAAMLATYPDVFLGGAIIAGLPYGTASSLSDAYESMSRGRIKDAKEWGDLVRAASPHLGPWPSVAIWHGTADPVVKPINAGELVKQWTNVHGLGAEMPGEDHVGAIVRRTWCDRKKRALVTEYSLPGLAHGAPVDDADPPAPFFLPAGISSTWRIAYDWGLTEPRRARSIGALFGVEPRSTEPLGEQPPLASALVPHLE